MYSINYITVVNARVLLVCMLSLALVACSTTGGDGGVPKPLEVITLDNMKANIVALWGTSDRDLFKTSSFSESERFVLLRRAVLERHLAVKYGSKGSFLENCSTLKLLAINPTPQKNDGSKNEIWDIDVCSVKYSVPMELTADERELASKHSYVITPSF
ncbi:hypothetical protein ACO0K7_07800 [Undibacterium sp. Ji67W]|uniref:hypothetical protein n=1 Tax=Undibacterium sp. Ji67W TaxID=3413042 RepID=UPI003BF25F09